MTVTRREHFLSVAAPLMAERGFHGTSIVELGKAMGVTGPALYRHFDTKQGVLDAMLLDISERLLAGGRERASHEDPLDSLVTFHIDFALREPDLIRVQDRDLSSLSDAGRRTVRRLQRAYVEIWVAALQERRPELGSDEARATVLAVVGLINSTPYNRTRLSQERMRGLLSELAHAALQVRP